MTMKTIVVVLVVTAGPWHGGNCQRRPPNTEGPSWIDLPVVEGLTPAAVDKDCIKAFEKLTEHQDYRYIIYQFMYDGRMLMPVGVGDRSSAYADFIKELTAEKVAAYAVYDFEYTKDDGTKTSKIVFIQWNKASSSSYEPTRYRAWMGAFKNMLSGVDVVIEADDASDLDWNTVITTLKQGDSS